jgi:hypothetical protein
LDPQHELITQKFAADTFQKKHHNTDAKGLVHPDLQFSQQIN